MKKSTALVCAFVGTLSVAVAAVAGPESDMDRSHPKEFVSDSAITTKIKTKLAADHISSLGRIHVDTDKDGVVWLSGTARSQEAINNAVAMARATENVRAVQSDIRVKADD